MYIRDTEFSTIILMRCSNSSLIPSIGYPRMMCRMSFPVSLIAFSIHLSTLLMSLNIWTLSWWKKGHCKIRCLASSTSYRSHRTHILFTLGWFLDLTSSANRLLEWHKIFIRISHFLVISGYLSEICHHTEYLVSLPILLSKSRLLCICFSICQYVFSSSQPLNKS